jgi:serine protease Do
MSTRKISLFYAILIAVASMAVTVVITSKMDLTPSSAAQTVAVPAANSAPLTGPIDATTFRNIAKATAPAVVNIQTLARARGRELTEYFGGQGDDLLRRFFGGGDDDQAPQPRGRGNRGRNDAPQLQGAGTGFIIDKSGFILTNNHVVEGAEKITVSLYGAERGQTYAAKVVGHDTLTDTALIQITEMPQQALTEVKFGDSEQM